jgi:predicted RNA binding protein YcfA (HicA-like mRNA interferase family)
MPRLTALHWKVLECIFEKDGFEFDRQEGSHRVYLKKGIPRPVIIPTYKDVDRDIILGLMRTVRMSRERFFELLEACK